MKILICSVSSALGGMERRIEAETRLLTQLGHEVFVATPRFQELDRWKSDIEKAGGRFFDWHPYKFVERQHFAAPFRWLASSSRLSLSREGFDFAHIALPWNFAGISMAYVLSRTKIPFVVSVHCKFSQQKLTEKGRATVLQAMRGFKGGYAVSSPVHNSFMNLYSGLLPPPQSFMEIVPNGIDVTRYRADATSRESVRKSLGLDPQDFVLIFCGRIDSMKRPLFALRVFAQFVAQYPRGQLLVVGDGSEMAELKSEVHSLGIQNRVTLTGQVPDTAPYYAASDCYLSTSTNQEGCPLAAAEALASGLPAVVPDDDVFNSIYGASNAVQRCNPSSPVGWDKAILSMALLDTEARFLLARDARHYAETKLSKEIMNRKLTTFYEKTFSRLRIG